MKTIISIHSFVDLITNSSSELFVLDTKKSVGAVKELIEQLAEIYNRKIEITDKSNDSPIALSQLWTDVFSEPTSVKYDFQLSDFPRYGDWRDMFARKYSGCFYSDTTDLHSVEQSAQIALEEWENAHPRPKYKKDPTEADNKEYENAYEKWHSIERKAVARIYKKWNKMVLDIYAELYNWTAKVNNIDLTPLGELKSHDNRYSSVYFTGMVGENYAAGKRLEAAAFIDEINDAISWGYTFKKGDIFLRSARDNSVPYGFWSDIDSVFSCQRQHLG